MGKKTYTVEQIIGKLREAEVAVGKGLPGMPGAGRGRADRPGSGRGEAHLEAGGRGWAGVEDAANVACGATTLGRRPVAQAPARADRPLQPG